MNRYRAKIKAQSRGCQVSFCPGPLALPRQVAVATPIAPGLPSKEARFYL